MWEPVELLSDSASRRRYNTDSVEEVTCEASGRLVLEVIRHLRVWFFVFVFLFVCESLYNYPSLVPAQVRRQTWQKLKQGQAQLHWATRLVGPSANENVGPLFKNEEFQDGYSRELKYRVLLSATIWVVHPWSWLCREPPNSETLSRKEGRSEVCYWKWNYINIYILNGEVPIPPSLMTGLLSFRLSTPLRSLEDPPNRETEHLEHRGRYWHLIVPSIKSIWLPIYSRWQTT